MKKSIVIVAAVILWAGGALAQSPPVPAAPPGDKYILDQLSSKDQAIAGLLNQNAALAKQFNDCIADFDKCKAEVEKAKHAAGPPNAAPKPAEVKKP